MLEVARESEREVWKLRMNGVDEHRCIVAKLNLAVAVTDGV
jgi:hypothetical protein